MRSLALGSVLHVQGPRPRFWIGPENSWIWKNVLESKQKKLEIEQIGLKPSPQEPPNESYSIKTKIKGSQQRIKKTPMFFLVASKYYKYVVHKLHQV